jgi:murein DD-endopeptidase MepM/ murein hydrolase activator NlpD
MRIPVEFVRPRPLMRVAALTVLSGLTAGCSADSSRFVDNPFSNPFRSQTQTASIPDDVAYPTPRVTSQPLAASTVPSTRPIAAQPLPPVGSVGTRPAAASPQPAYSFNRTGTTTVASTGTLGTAPRVTSSGRGGWMAEGGTVVTSREGDSAATLSNRYGVPADAIRRANGIGTGPLAAGQRITIPVYDINAVPERQTASVAPASHPVRTQVIALQPRPPRPVAATPAPARVAAARPVAGTVHVVKPGETLTSIALAYGTTRPKLAKANNIDEWMNVRIGQKLRVGGTPANVQASVKSIVTPKASSGLQTAAIKPQPDQEKKPGKPLTKPVVTAQASKPIGKPAKPKVEPAFDDGDDGLDETAALPPKPADEPKPRNAASFRWPVKGRVIQSFGQSTDGINISVPEGTEVKAAENGVVAYAGNELKGYGNLVLIRHADGFVTAYAHAKDLKVKRGDSVRRGETIATAGQTGNVTSPQLLFELRKGATPVDPRRYLAASN